jgi:hypothetical protein
MRSKAMASMGAGVWRPEYHLHLGQRVTERVMRTRQNTRIVTTLVRDRMRIELHRHVVMARSARWLTPDGGIARWPRPAVGVVPMARRGESASGAHALSARAHGRRDLAPRDIAVRTTGAMAMRQRVRARPLAPAREAETSMGRAAPRVALVSALRGPPARAGTTRMDRSDMGATRARAPRPAELAWRAAPADARAGDEGARVAALSGGSASHGAGDTSSRADAAAETNVAVQRAASVPVTSLDPALIERLTDDVIRRVERRVRIDRERRGL